ncbi:MAG: PD-(D/E)XK nuclease family protein [Thermoplasmata archaeon]|nr:PD-(D/E)XK nuclease family protein [Thermoplasmata archaeon]
MATRAPLSYSSVRTYLECPQRWKFLYVDHLSEAPRGYFSFGRTVHSVLEELVRPLVVPTARRTASGESQRTLDDWKGPGAAPAARALMGKEELLSAYARLWVSEGYNSPEEEARYRKLGEEILLGYHRKIDREPPLPVAVEEHLEADWGGITIHGYIDRIDRTPSGGLDVLDYKTSRELTKDDAEGSDQLGLYQVLVQQNYSEPVERLTLYHLRSLKPLRSEPRAPAALGELFGRVEQVADGLHSERYEPTPGRHCGRCEFRPLCPEFKSIPELEQARLSALVDRFGKLREEEHRVGVELRKTAEELHQEAERLGVHRLPGSREVAVRRIEESWGYALDAVRPVLEAHGLNERAREVTTESVRRLLKDPNLPAEARRKLSGSGGRKVRWYWELECSEAADAPRTKGL